MGKIIWTAAVALLMVAGSCPAEKYTLEQCIEMARKIDPDLTGFRNAVKTTGHEVWFQAGRFLPSFSASASYRKTEQGKTSEQIRDLGGGIIEKREALPELSYKDYSAGISLSHGQFNVLGTVWDYLQARARRHSAEYSYAQAVSDRDFLVKASYYLVLKSKHDLEVAQEAVKTSEELLRLFEEKYQLGSASRSEVLKQKVQYGNDQLTRVEAENTYQNYLDQLALTIGLSPDEEFDIAELERISEEVDELSNLIQKARQFHPALEAARENVAGYKHSVWSAYSEYLPKLDLSYSYGWSKNTFDDLVKFGSEDHVGVLRIGVSWNIFDQFSRKYYLGRARADLSNARAWELYTKNEVIKDIREAYLGIKLAEETLNVTEQTELDAREDMELVQAKYNLGAAALWELLDAQVSLKRARFNKVRADFDYNLALAKLKNAMGE